MRSPATDRDRAASHGKARGVRGIGGQTPGHATVTSAVGRTLVPRIHGSVGPRHSRCQFLFWTSAARCRFHIGRSEAPSHGVQRAPSLRSGVVQALVGARGVSRHARAGGAGRHGACTEALGRERRAISGEATRARTVGRAARRRRWRLHARLHRRVVHRGIAQSRRAGDSGERGAGIELRLAGTLVEAACALRGPGGQNVNVCVCGGGGLRRSGPG